MTTDPDARDDASAIYAGAILEQAPRALGLMDRETFSPTAGCCDRTYWAWKFVDFPRSRFQEALCVLAFLYATPLADSRYHRNQRLLEWIASGLRYWTTLQHPDGSFDEAYPYERSLAATAFTTFYVGETLQFLAHALPHETVGSVQKSMASAGRWLCRNDETHGVLSNHLAAAAAALQHAYRVTGDSSFDRRSRVFLERILDHQSSEGWYEEYGGADPGYQTHGSFYLARYWELTDRPDLIASLGRANRFLAHFVHVDGSLGGEYASRNTQTYYPAAFEMLAHRDAAAAWIAETMRPSVTSGAAVGLRSVDAYNYFPFLNNLVFSYLACRARTAPVHTEEPSRDTGLVWFPEAGMARVRRDRYDAYVGAIKGGVVKIFDRQRRQLIFSDCGYVGRLRNGRLLSTQHQDPGRGIRVEPDRIEIEGAFVEFSRPTMTPASFVAFRLFALSFGRLASLGRWLKQRLVQVLIYRKRPLRILFIRRIELQEDRVTIDDTVGGPDGEQVVELQCQPQFTTIHMGSSRYFISNEMEGPSPVTEDPPALSPRAIVAGITVRRIIHLNSVPPRSS